MLAECVDAFGVDTHRDMHEAQIAHRSGTPIGGALTQAILDGLARCCGPRQAGRDQAVRHAEIRRLAQALREASRGQQRAHHAPPPQPRRRPGPQPRDPHHRHDQDAQLLQNPRLLARRTADGKTTREIRRCLKPYIARELYRALTASMPSTTTVTTAT